MGVFQSIFENIELDTLIMYLIYKKYSVGYQYSSTLVVVCLSVVGFVFRFC